MAYKRQDIQNDIEGQKASLKQDHESIEKDIFNGCPPKVGDWLSDRRADRIKTYNGNIGRLEESLDKFKTEILEFDKLARPERLVIRREFEVRGWDVVLSSDAPPYLFGAYIERSFRLCKRVSY